MIINNITEAAVASPILLYLKAFAYIYITSVIVVLFGVPGEVPPIVEIKYGKSNN